MASLFTTNKNIILFFSLLYLTQANFVLYSLYDDNNIQQKLLRKSLENTSKLNNLEKKTAYFYKNRNYTPVWLTKNRWNIASSFAIKLIKKSQEEGLNPKKYEHIINKLKNCPKDNKSLIEVEILLTSTIIQYILDLTGARIKNPDQIDWELKVKPNIAIPEEILYKGFLYDETGEWLLSLSLDIPEYQSLKKLLKEYRTKKWPTLPSGEELKLNVKAERVLILRKILIAQNDLRKEQDKNPIFDLELKEAIKRFQSRHGLKIDGVVGLATFKALNKTPSEKINQIIVSMERCRWLPKNRGDRYIKVNIANFTLKCIQNEQVVLELPVIIGRLLRETPIITTKVTEVKFNPPWYVPYRIATRDKLKKIKKDPSYLTRNNYKLLSKNGKHLDPRQISWGEVNTRNFSYRIIQKPGPKNALGKIRFTMNNPYSIFMHDTPSKHLFEKTVRAFSSGCIRVKNPLELAFFVFNDPTNWAKSIIANEMKGNKTKKIKLSEPTPIYIGYFTVWTDKNGLTHFVNDIYGQDKQILKALNQNT